MSNHWMYNTRFIPIRSLPNEFRCWMWNNCENCLMTGFVYLMLYVCITRQRLSDRAHTAFSMVPFVAIMCLCSTLNFQRTYAFNWSPDIAWRSESRIDNMKIKTYQTQIGNPNLTLLSGILFDNRFRIKWW